MNPLKDYFYYSKKERLAVLLLSSFILVTLLASLCYYWLRPSSPLTPAYWDQELIAFEEQQQKAPRKKHYTKKIYASASSTHGSTSFGTTTRSYKRPLTPFPFDPNTVSAQELEAMGLSERVVKSWMNYRSKGGYFSNKEGVSRVYNLANKEYEQLKEFIQLPTKETIKNQPLPPAFDFDPNTSSSDEFAQLGLSSKTIKSIINYRSKGGYFKEATDFKKIYTLPDTVYQHLSAHIKIVQQPKKRTYATRKAPSYQRIDINTASRADFEQFRGIGPSYAQRLLEWRERLGGFVEVLQVAELYRLPDSTFQQMRPFLSCAAHPLAQININTATIEELKNHPYLRWSHAKAIVYHREKKGPWKSVELLQILPELDDGQNTFERVRPYLTI
ncbi:MAG: helix-hairpin-helix domain-containing protein [Aureispira sp.]